ncbi:MAG: hypothetical protein ACRD10_12800, partial [Terriglobia bacterium]
MGATYTSGKLGTQERFGKAAPPLQDGARRVVPEETFARLLRLERRRAERSRRQFLVMLADLGEFLVTASEQNGAMLNKISDAILSATRETDIIGWYEQGYVLGAILTEIPPSNLPGAVNAV